MGLPQDIIGVDIAKGRIDTFILSSREHRRIALTKLALARFARSAAGALVVVEPSGGYERPLTEALARAQVDCARVNPRQAREYARATWRLAKTYRVDAEVLARMGRALNLAPTPPEGPDRARLSAFIASRHDPALKAFRQRLEAAGKPVKVAITACARKLLTILNAMVRNHQDYRTKPA